MNNMLIRRILIGKLLNRKILLSLILIGLFGFGFTVLVHPSEARINILPAAGTGLWQIQVRTQSYTLGNVTWNASQHSKASTLNWGYPLISYFGNTKNVYSYNNISWSIGTGSVIRVKVVFKNQMLYFNYTNVTLSTANVFALSSKGHVDFDNCSLFLNCSVNTNNLVSQGKWCNLSNCFVLVKGGSLSNSVLNFQINNSILSGVSLAGVTNVYINNAIFEDCPSYIFYDQNFVSVTGLILRHNAYPLVLGINPYNLKNIQFIDNTKEFYILGFDQHVNLTDCYFKNGIRMFNSGIAWTTGHLHLNNNLNVQTLYDGNGTAMKNSIVSVKRNDSVGLCVRSRKTP